MCWLLTCTLPTHTHTHTHNSKLPRSELCHHPEQREALRYRAGPLPQRQHQQQLLPGLRLPQEDPRPVHPPCKQGHTRQQGQLADLWLGRPVARPEAKHPGERVDGGDGGGDPLPLRCRRPGEEGAHSRGGPRTVGPEPRLRLQPHRHGILRTERRSLQLPPVQERHSHCKGGGGGGGGGGGQ